MSESGRAPFGVRVIGWLIIVSGTLQIAVGIAIIALRDDVTDQAPEYSTGEVTAIAIAAVAFGLIYLLVGRGFLRLSRLALMVLAASWSGLRARSG